MQKKTLTLTKKALQPIKKKTSHRKKAQKSTMVLLKALTTIPETIIMRSSHMYMVKWSFFVLSNPKTGWPCSGLD